MKDSEFSILQDPDWRQVPGWPKYLVNRGGQVYSTHSRRLLSPYTRNNSPAVQVSNNPKIQLAVREMVAGAWMPVVPGKPHVCHRNNDYHDCRVENLEYRAEPQIRQGRRKDASPSVESVRAQLYTIWQAMKQRCYNSKHPNYPNYGGRNIGVCNSWQKFQPFYDWAVRSGFKPGLSLDRKNNDEWYVGWNCRWTDQVTQCRNTRRNHIIEAWGEKKCLSEWVADPRCMVIRSTLVSRLIRGMTPELALSSPIVPIGRRKSGPAYEAWGEQKVIAEWARDSRAKVKKCAIAARLKKGWPVELAISTPPVKSHAGKKWLARQAA